MKEMFFDKIQVEILKNKVKRDLSIGKGGFNYRYGYFNDNIVVTDNHCCAIYLIPKDKFYLNLETVFKKDEIKFEKILKTEYEATDLICFCFIFETESLGSPYFEPVLVLTSTKTISSVVSSYNIISISPCLHLKFFSIILYLFF